jgi:hypothetical protein
MFAAAKNYYGIIGATLFAAQAKYRKNAKEKTDRCLRACKGFEERFRETDK